MNSDHLFMRAVMQMPRELADALKEAELLNPAVLKRYPKYSTEDLDAFANKKFTSEAGRFTFLSFWFCGVCVCVSFCI